MHKKRWAIIVRATVLAAPAALVIVLTSAFLLEAYPFGDSEKMAKAWQFLKSTKGVNGQIGQKHALEDLYQGGEDLRNIDLGCHKEKEQGTTKTGDCTYLSSVDLTPKKQGNTKRADLDGAILTRAFLGKANLRGVNLHKADLSRALLWDANLTNANLRAANLSRADLYRADLSGAKLHGAKLISTSLCETDFYRATGLTQSIIDSACILENWGTRCGPLRLPDGLAPPTKICGKRDG